MENLTLKEKLYNWINGIIVYDFTRREYLDVVKLICTTLKKGEDTLKSTITIDDETYEFKMTLKKIK